MEMKTLVDKIWTILEIIKSATAYLESKKIEEPRLTAEILLANVLNCKRIDLYLQFDRPLKDDERSSYRNFLKRRAMREPVQYIIGEAEFFGYKLTIKPNVLIPRPETEFLVETVLDLCDKYKNYQIWDLGCGSGAIAIALAKNLPNAHFTASDVSEDAVRLSQHNAEFNQVEKKIDFLLHDMNKNVDKDFIFDIIISNPPYVDSKGIENLMPEVRYEPQIALDGGEDGLFFYRRIIQIANQHLAVDGMLALEIGDTQASMITKLLGKAQCFFNHKVYKDYAKKDRVIVTFKGSGINEA